MKNQKPFLITVLASGNGSNLQALIDDCAARPSSGCVINAVLSNCRDAFALQRAEAAGIPTVCIEHQKFPSREAFDRRLLEAVLAGNPQLVVLAGFMRILTEEFVLPLSGCLINLHPSLLPRHPGMHTHRQALAAGDREHGATVHFVIPELDAGPRIIQGRIDVREAELEKELKARVRAVEHQIVVQAVRWFSAGRLRMEADRVRLDGELLPLSGYVFRPQTEELSCIA